LAQAVFEFSQLELAFHHGGAQGVDHVPRGFASEVFIG
jgi:hypothetical protein